MNLDYFKDKYKDIDKSLSDIDVEICDIRTCLDSINDNLKVYEAVEDFLLELSENKEISEELREKAESLWQLI